MCCPPPAQVHLLRRTTRTVVPLPNHLFAPHAPSTACMRRPHTRFGVRFRPPKFSPATRVPACVLRAFAANDSPAMLHTTRQPLTAYLRRLLPFARRPPPLAQPD